MLPGIETALYLSADTLGPSHEGVIPGSEAAKYLSADIYIYIQGIYIYV